MTGTLAYDHPMAPFNLRAAILALGWALLALAGWSAWRSGFSADLAGLLAGHALAVGLLEPTRRWQRAGLAIATAVGVLALSTWLGGALAHALRVAADAGPRPWRLPDAVPMAVLWPLLLPGIVRRWLAWREQRTLAEQAERHAVERTLLEARLAALQGQIEPHFLFNTLANVQYLLRHDAALADRMLERLNAYLRATLPELRQAEATLGQELARVEAYLDIMRIRMGERLRYAIDSPAGLADALLPPLALATLVENALKHGLEPKRGDGRIDIVAWRDGARLRVAVEDDGVGFSESGGGHGIGLRNLRERLAALFGAEAGLLLAARPDGGVRAELNLPLRRREGAA
ncbi:sensor histidine kinase [Chitinimonas koreensis]|uniref:sensor histidine kinase n=1 Tax=Chitinimonas koreensis TaxID=356302 RepID=UPI000688707D|nr:histidine kinase [Chitinimonas koreensis]QNM96839.1 histidine kinase [Chitinimonas koreensis]